MRSTSSSSATSADADAARPASREAGGWLGAIPGIPQRFGALRGWNGGAALVSALGGLLFAGHLGYVLTHAYYLRLSAGLYAVSLVILVVLSASLVYGGYWVKESDLDADTSWRVGLWSLAGVIGVVSMTFWPMLYQRLVGVTVEDPVFVLLVSAGLGANAGLLIGVHTLQSRQRLEQVEEARDGFQFLNRLLRHNVLNAITIVHGYAELLREQAEDRTVDDHARKIQAQSRHVSDLVENAKVLVERLHGERSVGAVDLSALVANEVDTLRTIHEDATIETDLEAGVHVRATELLASVVENVVSNAVVHHDQPPASVEVRLRAREAVAVLEVTDDGPGIPDDRKEVVFEPGEHGDNGLGLYLVRTLVADYGGTVSLDDNEPRGTVVTVELPLAEGSASPGG